MWALKILHEKNWRVSLCVIHQIFPEFSQPLRVSELARPWVGKQRVSPVFQQRVSPFFLWHLLIGLWGFIGLVNIGPPWSLINRSWHIHWRDVTFNSILSFSSLSVTYCRWWRRARRRCRTMNLLSWRCHWSWRMRTGGRTRWQAWNPNKNEVLRVALYPNPIFNVMCFLTVDPFIRIPVFIGKLTERQYCWRVPRGLS